MLRRYSRGFFDLQVRFACLIAERLGLSLSESLSRFTTFPLSLDFENTAEEFGARISREDPVEVAWDLYIGTHPNDWEDLGTEWHGHRLFGCFKLLPTQDPAPQVRGRGVLPLLRPARLTDR